LSSGIGYAIFTVALHKQVMFDNFSAGSSSNMQGGGAQMLALLQALPLLEQTLKVRSHRPPPL
jgi:hypothetical protein